MDLFRRSRTMNAALPFTRTVSSTRLLDALPAVYRTPDGPLGGEAGSAELQALLAAFETLLLGPPGAAHPVGYEQRIAALPALLAPQPAADGPAYDDAVRAAFLPWLAARWVAFAPWDRIAPHRLARVVAGIVPLYGRRGTRGHLVALLQLCFDEITEVRVHEHDGGGLRVGQARLGSTSVLGGSRAFWFRVELVLSAPAAAWQALEPQVRAVIDFAKPAHVAYSLEIAPRAA
ncbi:MAG: hypothetical protein EPO01_04120 [Aquabacterium sp.]|nr:MAG: hypothetical protein EPO01_04120 [Aquabacterium sp.]